MAGLNNLPGGSETILIVDDQETVILSGNLLEGVDEDLDSFFKELMKD